MSFVIRVTNRQTGEAQYLHVSNGISTRVAVLTAGTEFPTLDGARNQASFYSDPTVFYDIVEVETVKQIITTHFLLASPKIEPKVDDTTAIEGRPHTTGLVMTGTLDMRKIGGYTAYIEHNDQELVIGLNIRGHYGLMLRGFDSPTIKPVTFATVNAARNAADQLITNIRVEMDSVDKGSDRYKIMFEKTRILAGNLKLETIYKDA